MNQFVNLKGLLLPEDFDENGTCIAISLCVENERAYAVHDGTVGQNLQSFLRQPVHVQGQLEVLEGKPQITVLNIWSQSD
jgi:hypothetical protein